MNFTNLEEAVVWKTLAAILLIGNLEFDDSKFDEVNSPCKICETSETQNLLTDICNLMECEAAKF